MHDLARLVHLLANLPHLLDADAVRLGVLAVAQVEPVLQRLGERAVRALGDERALGMELHAGLVRLLGLAVLVEPDIARRNALDPLAVLGVEHACARESRVHLDAGSLGLLAEPGGEA